MLARMPVFEYRCRACRKKFMTLVGMTAEPDAVVCPTCGSGEADKLVSRFVRGRTEDDRVDELADRLEDMEEPESPRELRTLVREMGKAMDEDMSDEMEEMFENDVAGDAAEDSP